MIECYKSRCPYHICNFEEDGGPFCNENECKESEYFGGETYSYLPEHYKPILHGEKMRMKVNKQKGSIKGNPKTKTKKPKNKLWVDKKKKKIMEDDV
jgi:hypothetical protein